MFERFTRDARGVVLPLAEQQARRWPTPVGGGRPVITAVHFLLALATTEHGPAAKVLRAHGITADAIHARLADRVSDLDGEALATLGIDIAAVREAAEATFGPGALEFGGGVSGRAAFGQSGKQVLVFAVRAAVGAHANRIGTEHLLHGLLKVGDATVTDVLTALNVDQDALSAEVTALIGAAAA